MYTVRMVPGLLSEKDEYEETIDEGDFEEVDVSSAATPLAFSGDFFCVVA